jgi:hypothetical protein
LKIGILEAKIGVYLTYANRPHFDNLHSLYIEKSWSSGKTVLVYKLEKDKDTYIHEYSLNPLWYLWYAPKHRFDTWVIKTFYRDKLCPTCGEGVIKWKIESPNYKDFTNWRCCDFCVGFYDVKYTAKLL